MRIRTWTICGLALWMLAVIDARAESTAMVLSLTPHLLSVEGKKDKSDALTEARLKSGLGLRVQGDVLQLDVDYDVQVQLNDEADDAALSQRLGAKLYSNRLNRLLGIKADIRAGSIMKHTADAYSHSITPGFSKPISDLATLSVQYQYSLDQANAKTMEKEKSGYRMGLSGAARDGRLTWQGNYGSTDVSDHSWRVQSTEFLEFESRYQLVHDLKLELSALSKNETIFNGGLPGDDLSEVRYGAGVAWSPSQYYSVAVKVNKRRESRGDPESIFGSGVLSWHPNRDMKVTVSYGDHLIGGARALMLGTRIDLGGS